MLFSAFFLSKAIAKIRLFSEIAENISLFYTKSVYLHSLSCLEENVNLLNKK